MKKECPRCYVFPESGELEGVFSFENGGNVAGEPDPFYVVLIGDWAGGSVSRPLEVDRDSFAEVIERFEPSIELDFEDTEVKLSIAFHELNDFHPDNIFRTLPIFAELRDLRLRLQATETFSRAANEVRAWFDGAKSGVSDQVDENSRSAVLYEPLLGDILDSASRESRLKESELGRFVSKIVAPYIVQVNEDGQSKLTAWLDGAAFVNFV